MPSQGSERHRSTILIVVKQEGEYVQVMKPDGRRVWYADISLHKLSEDESPETQKK